jgi:hypothetical protein
MLLLKVFFVSLRHRKKGKSVVNDINSDDDEASDSRTNEGGDECDNVDDEVIDNDEDGLPDELDELSEEELSSVKRI